MEAKKLYAFIQDPLNVTEDYVEDLKRLVNKYPFFQAGRFLLALTQPTTEHIKEAAISSQDRNLLKKMIDFKINPYKVEHEFEEVATDESDSLVDDQPKVAPEALSLEAEQVAYNAEDSTDLNDQEELLPTPPVQTVEAPAEPLSSDLPASPDMLEDTSSADLNEQREPQTKSPDLALEKPEDTFSVDKIMSHLEQYKLNFEQFEADIQTEKPAPQQVDNSINFESGFALDEDLDHETEDQATLISNFINGYRAGMAENSFLPERAPIDLAQLDEQEIIAQSASPALAEFMLSKQKYEQASTIYKTLAQREPHLQAHYNQKMAEIEILRQASVSH